MGRIFVTGMSGTGKSTVLAELARRSFETVDTDEGDWTRWSGDEDGYVWVEERIAELLTRERETTLYRSGTVSNQGRSYAAFDAVVLLSAPAEVLMRRIETRTSNNYGKHPTERALIQQHLAEVEPLLRRTCTHELDTTRPIDEIADDLVLIGQSNPGT